MKKRIRKALLVSFGSSLLLAQDRPQCNKKHDGWYWTEIDGSVKECVVASGKYKWSEALGHMRASDMNYAPGSGPGTELAMRDKDGVARRHSSK